MIWSSMVEVVFPHIPKGFAIFFIHLTTFKLVGDPCRYCPYIDYQIVASLLMYFFSPLDIHWSAMLLNLERERETHGSFSLMCVSHPLAFFSLYSSFFLNLYLRRCLECWPSSFPAESSWFVAFSRGKVELPPSAGHRKDCKLTVQRYRVTD